MSCTILLQYGKDYRIIVKCNNIYIMRIEISFDEFKW